MDSRKVDELRDRALLQEKPLNVFLAKQEQAAREQASPGPALGDLPPGKGQEPTVTGPGGEPLPAKYLTLGIEKFTQGGKHYRLIWVYGKSAWLAGENTERFRTKWGAGGVIEAGRKLAREKKCRKFSEVTR